MMATIRHDNLRKAIAEVMEDYENASDEAYARLFYELQCSRLLCAGEKVGDSFNILTINLGENINLMGVFTDEYELRKVFPDFNVECQDFPMKSYVENMKESDMMGMMINSESEAFVMPTELLDGLGQTINPSFSSEDAYTPSELKELKDCLNNDALEQFIRNPKNVGRYEELFELISKSVILTLAVSDDDLSSYSENGIISMEETGPLGRLYLDMVGGRYSTVFTSEEKMKNVDYPMSKYSIVINFAQLVYHVFEDDLDGVTINPGSDNIIITREVLFEFSNLIEETCNDSRLNTGIFNMFEMEA